MRGSIEQREVVERAIAGATHVVHLATCKETPDTIMDVAVKGLFWLLEACRESPTFRQFILLGGDAAIGHFVYPHPLPVTETQGHTAYPGCYALSKVLEEVMLEQYGIQYDLNVCCLRAPWIMEKDDFSYQLSFGEDVFGGPRWRDLVGAERADAYVASGTVPVMLDPRGPAGEAELRARRGPGRRDPGRARQPCGAAADLQRLHGRAGRLRRARRLPVATARLPDGATSRRRSTRPGWTTRRRSSCSAGGRSYDLRRLVDEAWAYERAADDPRTVWYPG